MNEHLRRALEALEAGATEAREVSLRSTEGARRRVRRTIEEVLDHLEQDVDEPEDVISALDRKAQDIADDLRRAERLMRQRTGGE